MPFTEYENEVWDAFEASGESDWNSFLAGYKARDINADKIADAVVCRLAAEGYDAFRPNSYHDISPIVRKVIAEEVHRALDKNDRAD